MRFINLDLTPEEALSSKAYKPGYGEIPNIRVLGGVEYPFIDVWDFQIALAWMIFSEDATTSTAKRLPYDELERLGITEDMLHEALYTAGGDITRNGHYPISQEIREILSDALKNNALDRFSGVGI